MRILVVDDEELARLRIVQYLRRHHPTFVVEEATDGFEALNKLATFVPDVLFLDVEMPELSGFDVLLQVAERSFKLIFQTAYDEFAVRAFDECAVDYLLKPFTDERLAAALAKAGAGNAVRDLAAHLATRDVFLAKLMIRAGTRLRVVESTDVVYFFSEAHATRLFLPDVDFVYDHSLTFLEARLDPSRFVRTHRNSIINLSQVASVAQGPNTTVTLKSGTTLPVSRERKKRLLELLASPVKTTMGTHAKN